MTTIALGDGGTISGEGAFPRARHEADGHDLVVGALLVVFLVFFFTGARMNLRGLPIRVEDLTFLLLLPLGYKYLPVRKTKLYWLITAYFGMNLIPYLAAYIAGEYTLGIYPIIMIKEIQYFYVAYLICKSPLWWVLATVDALAVILIANGLRLLAKGEIDYYGIGALGTFQSPSLAGALYFFSTVWLHIRSKLLPTRALRWSALVIVLLGAVCVVATVSRSSIGALVIYVGIYLLLASLIGFAAWMSALGLAPKLIQTVALGMGVGYGFIAQALIRRAGQITESGQQRSAKWVLWLNELEPLDWIFGKGKGWPNAWDHNFGLGIDSQYVRTVLENGLLGAAIITSIVLMMLIEIKRRDGEYAHAWAVVFGMLVLSVPLEALQVSKSGGFFWLVMFYLLMRQRRHAPVAVAHES